MIITFHLFQFEVIDFTNIILWYNFKDNVLNFGLPLWYLYLHEFTSDVVVPDLT